MDNSQLESLYGKYGFQTVPTGFQDVVAFSLRSGYFLNADVIALSGSTNINHAKTALEKSGYACTIRTYNNIEEAEQELFAGFFTAEGSRIRLRQDYDRFARAISNSWGASYSYVSTPYISDASKADENEPVVDHISRLLKDPEPTLIILEAAAGFGKTCTAYEVLIHLLDESKKHVPILTELSLNRQAKIFRYVLLDEINRSLPGLRYELVEEQIQKGRMPMIIDGFDELLTHRLNAEDVFSEAEPMLETIGQMLVGKAKVLLTTRRTAIFSEQEFEKWRESKLGNINVHRVKLERPTLENWIGEHKLSAIKRASIPITELANPVLLAFLRNLDDNSFNELCKSPNAVVERYFEALLEREIIRQELKLSVSEQLQIFHSLAENMLCETFTTEAKEIIQLRIADSHKDILEQARSKYAREERPSIEEIAEKLSNHALLDRRSGNDQNVGFVNDFILGSLIGDVIYEKPHALMTTSDLELFVDIASTAYNAQTEHKKIGLWEKIQEVVELFDTNGQLKVDINLRDSFQRPLHNGVVENLTITGCIIGNPFEISNSTLVGCSFNNCIFNVSAMDNIYFSGCTFNECTIEGFPKGPISVFGCTGDDSYLDFLELQDITFEAIKDVPEAHHDEISSFERGVLMNFWQPGRAHANQVKAIRSLYRGFAKSDYIKITEAIEHLRKRDILELEGDVARLNIDKIAEVATLLGR